MLIIFLPLYDSIILENEIYDNPVTQVDQQMISNELQELMTLIDRNIPA